MRARAIARASPRTCATARSVPRRPRASTATTGRPRGAERLAARAARVLPGRTPRDSRPDRAATRRAGLLRLPRWGRLHAGRREAEARRPAVAAPGPQPAGPPGRLPDG